MPAMPSRRPFRWATEVLSREVHSRLLQTVDETVVRRGKHVCYAPLRGNGEIILEQARGKRLLAGDDRRYRMEAATQEAARVGCPQGCCDRAGGAALFTSTHATFYCRHPVLVERRITLLHRVEAALPVLSSDKAVHAQTARFRGELRKGVWPGKYGWQPEVPRGGGLVSEQEGRELREAMGGLFALERPKKGASQPRGAQLCSGKCSAPRRCKAAKRRDRGTGAGGCTLAQACHAVRGEVARSGGDDGPGAPSSSCAGALRARSRAHVAGGALARRLDAGGGTGPV
jgi:hypothetical protein